MTTVFQNNAFQNDAFQIEIIVVIVGGGVSGGGIFTGGGNDIPSWSRIGQAWGDGILEKWVAKSILNKFQSRGFR